MDAQPRYPPDFSARNWKYKELCFTYVKDGDYLYKQLLTEDIRALANSKIKAEIKLHESDPHWVLSSYFFEDLDKEDYAEKYKDYHIQPNENLVVGCEIRIFGKPIIRELQFLKLENEKEDLKHGTFWFFSDKKWQESNFGDSVSPKYITDASGKAVKIIVSVSDFYKKRKTVIEVKPHKK